MSVTILASAPSTASSSSIKKATKLTHENSTSLVKNKEEKGEERSSRGKVMARPIPEDVKKRAEEKCAKDYPYLTVQDPGTACEIGGKWLVYVWDKNKRGLWLEVEPTPKEPWDYSKGIVFLGE